MAGMRALVWLRSDLRAADNPALHEAARRSDRGVVAVYTICPKQWQTHDTAPIRVDFVLRNLTKLSAALDKRNVALRILTVPTFDGVPAALRRLAKTHDCDALFFNREHEINERRRDDAVTAAFDAAGLDVFAFTDQCTFEPGTLRTGSGRFYTVFTPFKRAWSKAYDLERPWSRPLGPPRAQAERVGEPDAVPDAVKGFATDEPRHDLWPAGERAARDRLRRFVAERIGAYQDDRNAPGIAGTSVLSPYLACGVVSPRQCLHAAVEANDGRVDSGDPGIVCWIGELIWREFYRHILVGFPRVCMHRAFRVETEAVAWRDDDDGFEAWCAGRTGIPIVDAAMRQLARTGWMHNRLRMVTAMFLSKNLLIDWRRGERFFMQHLIDGDLASNNGGWQWAASTGTDAAPYFRVFNPCSQSKRFDPDGAFIRRFVPELSDVEVAALHAPERIADDVRAAIDYPAPVVDLASSRRRAIDAFRTLTPA